MVLVLESRILPNKRRKKMRKNVSTSPGTIVPVVLTDMRHRDASTPENPTFVVSRISHQKLSGRVQAVPVCLRIPETATRLLRMRTPSYVASAAGLTFPKEPTALATEGHIPEKPVHVLQPIRLQVYADAILIPPSR